MSAIDVSAIVSSAVSQVVPIGLVGMAFLLLTIAVKAFRFVRAALGVESVDQGPIGAAAGDGFTVASPSDADFFAAYDRGESVEGVDFVSATSSAGYFHTLTVNGVEKTVWIDTPEDAASDVAIAAEDAAIDARYAIEPVDLTVKLGGGWK